MSAPLQLSVVLPAYLEAENLRLLLPRLSAELKRLGHASEIVVVDTHLPLDETEKVCLEHGARYIRRAAGNSFGDAVRAGIAAAQGVWIVCMDADGSHAPEFVAQLVAQATLHDVVIASRYVAGGHTENTLPLKIMSRTLNWTYALVLNLPYKDVSNSFKLYQARLLKGLTLRCDNFDIIEEILFKIKRANPGLRVIEIPFSFKKRMFGETKRSLLAFILTYVFTMIRLRFLS